VAFLDADPAAEGHARVAPTEHAHGLLDLDGATAAALFTTTRVVALAVDRVLDPADQRARRVEDAEAVGLERRWMDDEATERLAARIRAEM
jgi:diadenosine tetraphosphate (Ap4A) HIT family hydrolase